MFFVDAIEVSGLGTSHVVEPHVRNDYVTGGLGLARLTGAAYLVPAGARVSFERTPVRDGDVSALDGGLTLRAPAAPGHAPHHTSCALEENGTAVAVFTGGSLLIGTVGRPDLVEPRLTGRPTRARHASAHRLAAELPTHGFGSFCPYIPAYCTHTGPANAAGPAGCARARRRGGLGPHPDPHPAPPPPWSSEPRDGAGTGRLPAPTHETTVRTDTRDRSEKPR